MSKSALDALYAAYQTALDGADYDTAIAKLMGMQALLASMPDVATGVGGGGNSTRFRDSQIDDLIKRCYQLKAEAQHAVSGPFQQTKVTYARASS